MRAARRLAKTRLIQGGWRAARAKVWFMLPNAPSKRETRIIVTDSESDSESVPSVERPGQIITTDSSSSVDSSDDIPGMLPADVMQHDILTPRPESFKPHAVEVDHEPETLVRASGSTLNQRFNMLFHLCQHRLVKACS